MNQYLYSSPIHQEIGMAFVRIVTGLFLIYHGAEIFDTTAMNGYLEWDMFKSGNGKMLVYLGKGLEFTAGILLTLGFLTRLGALLTIGALGYIAFFVGKGIIWYDDQYPFLYVLLGMVFFVMGGGSWSLDKRFFG